MHPSSHPWTYSWVSPPTDLYISTSINLSCIHPPTHPSTLPSIHPSTLPPIHQSVSQSVSLPTDPYISTSIHQ
jgi:hypothetical protein